LIRDTALEDARMTSFRLKWYTDLSEELRKYGIPVHEIPKLVKLVNNIRQYDYDVEKVINEFSDLEHLRLQRKNLQETILFLEDTNRKLQEQRAGNEVFVNKHNQLIKVYEDLDAMKFGIKELWFLRNRYGDCA
jgi:predicted transcriptional regulator